MIRSKPIKKINTFFVHIIILFIEIYKKTISPFLPNACRFEPSCSIYMKDAIQTHGIFKGLYLGIRRILRCHPWGESGFDPVPQKSIKKPAKKR
jgi:putative membrane protein insertion efficiency factor